MGFQPVNYTFNEVDGFAQLTVVILRGGLERDVTVQFSTSSGTATEQGLGCTSKVWGARARFGVHEQGLGCTARFGVQEQGLGCINYMCVLYIIYYMYRLHHEVEVGMGFTQPRAARIV